MAIRRRLAEIDPDTYLVTLAEALINLAAQQRESGDHAEAVASISESVEISRRFAETDTRAHLPVLAKSLTNLGSHQHAWGTRPPRWPPPQRQSSTTAVSSG